MRAKAAKPKKTSKKAKPASATKEQRGKR